MQETYGARVVVSGINFIIVAVIFLGRALA